MKKVCIALDYSLVPHKLVETGYTFAKALNAEVPSVHLIYDATM